MKKLVKCHLKYIFNKVSLSIYILLSVFLLIMNISIILNVDNRQGIELTYISYLNGAFPLCEIIGVFYTIIIFSYPFLSKQDQYILLVINEKYNKNDYYITKYLCLIIISCLFVLIEFLIFYIPFLLFSETKYISIKSMKMFMDVFLIYIYYGNVSLFLIIIFDNIYMITISLSLYVFSNSLNENYSSINYLIEKILISMNKEKWCLGCSYPYIVFMILLLFSINYIIYQKKDF